MIKRNIALIRNDNKEYFLLKLYKIIRQREKHDRPTEKQILEYSDDHKAEASLRKKWNSIFNQPSHFSTRQIDERMCRRIYILNHIVTSLLSL